MDDKLETPIKHQTVTSKENLSLFRYSAWKMDNLDEGTKIGSYKGKDNSENKEHENVLGKRMADGNLTREEKERKWKAKQQRKQEAELTSKSRLAWIEEHANFAAFISEKDVAGIRLFETKATSELGRTLGAYVDIQDKPIKESSSKTLEERLFIAEGTETIRLLVQQSTQPTRFGLNPIEIKSVFVKPSILFEDPVNLLSDIKKAMVLRNRTKKGGNSSPGFKVLVGSESTLSAVAGFPVTRGALSCGVVPQDRNEDWLNDFLSTKIKQEREIGVRILAVDGVCDTSNLGSMIRCASAFGVDVVVLSRNACDCWYRRAIRVSMGHVFKIPCVRVQDLATEIRKWAGMNIRSYAAVIDTDKLLGDLEYGKVPPSWCCVMGNESKGVNRLVADACTQRVRIDMVNGVDSLSVPIACGIILNGLREREGKKQLKEP